MEEISGVLRRFLPEASISGLRNTSAATADILVTYCGQLKYRKDLSTSVMDRVGLVCFYHCGWDTDEITAALTRTPRSCFGLCFTTPGISSPESWPVVAEVGVYDDLSSGRCCRRFTVCSQI
jgi:hypothetical protein